jgi:two-component system LytT family response regulator
MPTAIIIDDQRSDREALKKLLEQHPDIVVEQECDNAAKGIKAIEKHRPDVVFLDVEMPEMDGLQMLAAMGTPDERDFAVIFITTYTQYAVEAFNLAALHYILKPIDPAKLDQAIDWFRNGRGNVFKGEKMGVLRHNQTATASEQQKIALSKSNGTSIVFIKDIAYCCAASVKGKQGAYTHFVFAEDQPFGFNATPVAELECSGTLKHFEDKLSVHGFIRMSKYYLINPVFVSKVEEDSISITFRNKRTEKLRVEKARHLLRLMPNLS